MDEIQKAESLQAELLKQPQVKIDTTHLIHGQMYARTILVPANTVVVGALTLQANRLGPCGHGLDNHHPHERQDGGRDRTGDDQRSPPLADPTEPDFTPGELTWHS
jgi:hypothetical protein